MHFFDKEEDHNKFTEGEKIAGQGSIQIAHQIGNDIYKTNIHDIVYLYEKHGIFYHIENIFYTMKCNQILDTQHLLSSDDYYLCEFETTKYLEDEDDKRIITTYHNQHISYYKTKKISNKLKIYYKKN